MADEVGDFTVTGDTEDENYSYAGGVLTIKTGTPLTIKNTDSSKSTTDRIVIGSGVTANLTFAGVNKMCIRDSIRTQLYTEDKKFKQKLSYASKLGIPYAVIIGEDEVKNGLVALKDMRRGEQVSCTPDEAAERILSGLGESAGIRLIKEK